NKITGIEFTKEQAIELLEKIEIKFLSDENDKLFFEIPESRREDLQREIDLVEEVLRLWGYNKIEDSVYDKISFDTKDYFNKAHDFINSVKSYLIGRGFKEVLTNSLVDEKTVSSFNNDYISLLNPSNDQMTVLRTNLYNGLFDVVRKNFEHMNNSLKFFEVGNTFAYGNKGEVVENKSIIIALAGEYDVEYADIKPRYFDILDIKAEVKALLEKLNIDIYNINYYNYSGNFEFQADYEVKGNIIAKISKFSDNYLEKNSIGKPVLVCEIPCLV